mmetsp:Transcript_2803/g.5336  ORF Transcript_2803/g.5336 Transcript_2803/m.5336 type:complete len:153 (+) Transcript_2803:39-497(+)
MEIMTKKLSIWKRLASKLSNHGIRKIKLPIENSNRLILNKRRHIVKKFLKKKIIIVKKFKGVSSLRYKINKKKKGMGRKRGLGKRKGTKKARKHPRNIWIKKIRLLRLYLKKKRYDDKTFGSYYKKIYKKVNIQLQVKRKLFLNKKKINRIY